MKTIEGLQEDKVCSNCVYIDFDVEIKEHFCSKLSSFTTLDDYCGYWESG